MLLRRYLSNYGCGQQETLSIVLGALCLAHRALAECPKTASIGITTYVVRLLAEEIGWKVADLDEGIERRCVSDIFIRQGGEAFRRITAEVPDSNKHRPVAELSGWVLPASDGD